MPVIAVGGGIQVVPAAVVTVMLRIWMRSGGRRSEQPMAVWRFCRVVVVLAVLVWLSVAPGNCRVVWSVAGRGVGGRLRTGCGVGMAERWAGATEGASVLAAWEGRTEGSKDGAGRCVGNPVELGVLSKEGRNVGCSVLFGVDSRLARGVDCSVAFGVDSGDERGVDCSVAFGVDSRLVRGVDCSVAFGVDSGDERGVDCSVAFGVDSGDERGGITHFPWSTLK